MKLVNVSQGSEAWLRWRDLGLDETPHVGIGASNAAVVTGVSAYKSRWRLGQELVHAFTGGQKGLSPVDLSNNPLVTAGKENEDRARQRIEAHLDMILLPVCAESPDFPFLRASMDGITLVGEPTEIKCPATATFRDVLSTKSLSNAFLHHWWQVQHQTLVLGAKRGFLFFWMEAKIEDDTIFLDGKSADPADVLLEPIRRVLRSGDFVEPLTGFGGEALLHAEILNADEVQLWLEFVIEADEQAHASYAKQAAEFVSMIEDGNPPPKDPARDPYEPQTDEEKARWSDLATRWRTLKSQEVKLETDQGFSLAERKQIDGKLLAASFPYPWGEYADLRVSRFWQKGRVDPKAAIAGLGIDKTKCDEFRSHGRMQVRVTDQASSTRNYCAGDDDDGEIGETDPVLVDFWKGVLAGKDSKSLAAEEGYVPKSDSAQAVWDELAAKRRDVDPVLKCLKKDIDALKAERKLVEAQLEQMMGDFASGHASGLLISKFYVDGQINLSALLAAAKIPDSALEPYRAQGSVRYRVTDNDKGGKRVAAQVRQQVTPIQIGFVF